MPSDPVNEPPPDLFEPETPDPPEIPGHRATRFGLWFYGAMALAAVIWRVGFYDEPIFFLTAEQERLGVDWLRDGALGLVVGAVVIAVSELSTRYTDWGERLARALAEPLAGLDVPSAILLALASGLAEEMLFRGALQPRVGLIVASLIFGLIHIGPSRDLAPWTLFAVVVGVVLGCLFEWTGNLLAPVLAHTLINAVNLPRLILRYRGVSGPLSRIPEGKWPRS